MANIREILRRFRKRGDVRFAQMALAVPPDHSGDIADIFYSGRGRRIHKWTHYLPIYERIFGDLRGKPFKMLEIGVFGGGSIDLWREYFGPTPTIYGIDINPKCAVLDSDLTPVRIGSQDDREFVTRVVTEMGGVDVVLDDGSHIGRHQWASFEILWPLLSENGLYVIEDVHTSYWKEYEGAYGKRRTAIGLAKQLIDDVHGWYHNRRTATSAQFDVGCVQIFDSIIVIEKQRRSMPGHIIVEQGSSIHG